MRGGRALLFSAVVLAVGLVSFHLGRSRPTSEDIGLLAAATRQLHESNRAIERLGGQAAYLGDRMEHYRERMYRLEDELAVCRTTEREPERAYRANLRREGLVPRVSHEAIR